MTIQQHLFGHLFNGDDKPIHRPYNGQGFIGPLKPSKPVKVEFTEAVLFDIAKRYSKKAA